MRFKSRKWGSGWTAFTIVLVFWGVGVVVILWQWDAILSSLCMQAVEEQRVNDEEPIEARQNESERPRTGKARETTEESEVGDTAEEEIQSEPEEEAEEVPEEPEPLAAEVKWTEVMGSSPSWPVDFASPKDCQAVRANLLAVCRELDSRPYMQAKEFSQGSFGLVREIVKTLEAHPPVASGETFRYESFTENVFHLFRALGKNRTYMLVQILSREQDLAEPAAMSLFRWLLAGDQCDGEGTTIDVQRLYDYAAYFLNTLGGHAYINRRTPKIATLATFYSLVILDRAIQRDYNPHGVDPRPHIERCQALMALQEELVFKAQYLQVLDQMEEYWRSF